MSIERTSTIASTPGGSAAEARLGGLEGASSDLASEVTHELRNEFHRVYHWLDLVDRAALGDDGRRALDAAEKGLAEIEGLAIRTLDLSRPLELSRIRMTAGELIENAAVLLRRLGAADVDVNVAVPVDGTLSIDASHVSHCIEAVARRLWGATSFDARMLLRAELDDASRLVITIHPEHGGTPRSEPVAELVEWAHVERVVSHHGGQLIFEEGGGGERRVVLLLPIQL